MEITPEQLAEITKPPLLAVLSTVNRDGSPQATPLWYLYDGQYFKMTSRSGRLKVRNIRRDPRVTLTVLDTANYGKPLLVKGAAGVIEEGGDEFSYTMARRYEKEPEATFEADGLVDLAKRLGERRVIIRVTPERVTYGE